MGTNDSYDWGPASHHVPPGPPHQHQQQYFPPQQPWPQQQWLPAPPPPRRPSIIPTAVVSTLLSVVGAIPAGLASAAARRRGFDTQRYWVTFAVGFLVNSLVALAVAFFLPQITDLVNPRQAVPAPASQRPRPSTEPSPSEAPRTSASPSTLEPIPDASAQPSEAPPAVAPPPAAPPVDPESAALTSLGAHRERSLTGMTFSGQWAAQLSSKYPGVKDDSQLAANGTHVFGASDILAEHEQLRAAFSSEDVRLFLTTDYGSRFTLNGKPLWVTTVLGFDSKESVQTWCQRAYPSLSGDALANRCTPRQLRTPE